MGYSWRTREDLKGLTPSWCSSAATGINCIENVLTEGRFARISKGMTEAGSSVHRPPQPQWSAFFEARNERVWEWRYCDGGN